MKKTLFAWIGQTDLMASRGAPDVGDGPMLKDITEVRPLESYCIHIRFEDGAEGTVDVRELTGFVGVFEALKDPSYFARVQVNEELGTIEWPNGADIDPVVLYANVAKASVPTHAGNQ